MQAVANTVLTLRVEEPLASHAGSVTQARRYRVVNPRAYFRSVDTCSNISGRAVRIAVGGDVNDLRTVAVLGIEERWSSRVTMTCTGGVTGVGIPILVNHARRRHADSTNAVEQAIENEGTRGGRRFNQSISDLLLLVALIRRIADTVARDRRHVDVQRARRGTSTRCRKSPVRVGHRYR